MLRTRLLSRFKLDLFLRREGAVSQGPECDPITEGGVRVQYHVQRTQPAMPPTFMFTLLDRELGKKACRTTTANVAVHPCLERPDTADTRIGVVEH